MSSEPNKARLLNTVVWALLEQTFPEAQRQRNPGGKEPSPPANQEGLAALVALVDDMEPEVLAAMCGGVYDLMIEPQVTLACIGKTKDDRLAAATLALEALDQAIKADRTLGGLADYAELTAPQVIEAAGQEWLAGGLAVTIEILFTANSRAG